MTRTTAIIFANGFLRVIQRFADKQISIPRIALIFRSNFSESFFETDFLHVKVLVVPQPALPDGRSGTLLRPTQATAKRPLYKEPIARVWSIGSRDQHRRKLTLR